MAGVVSQDTDFNGRPGDSPLTVRGAPRRHGGRRGAPGARAADPVARADRPMA